MGKKYKNLYQEITTIDSLQKAFINASRGKRSSSGFLHFNEYAQVRILDIHQKLKNETWQASPLRTFIIYEPKRREIGAPSFADRVVHHAICSVINPIFDKTFLPYSFACRNNKGTHAGVKYIQAQLRKYNFKYYLKTDFKSYFPSIDRAILYKKIERKITCKKTIALLKKIIPETGKGVPIGALTSQLAANIYGNILDHYLHHELKVTFARYMDDVIILGDDLNQLRQIKTQIEVFAKEQMALSISRWNISSTSKGIDFLGYRIWKNHKLLRKSSVTRAKRKIKNAINYEDYESLTKFIGSWVGHAKFADTKNLRIWLNRQHDVISNLAIGKKQRKPNRLNMLKKIILFG